MSMIKVQRRRPGLNYLNRLLQNLVSLSVKLRIVIYIPIVAGTHMSVRHSSQHKSRRRSNRKQDQIGLWEQRTPKEGFEGNEAAKQDGWIWNVKGGKGMKEDELKAWLDEGEQ
jgi:hypothetical protein